MFKLLTISKSFFSAKNDSIRSKVCQFIYLSFLNRYQSLKLLPLIRFSGILRTSSRAEIKGHNSNDGNVQKLISLSIYCVSSAVKIQSLSWNTFLQIVINSNSEISRTRKKVGSLFLMVTPCINVLTLACTRVEIRYVINNYVWRTELWSHRHTDNPEAICLLKFLILTKCKSIFHNSIGKLETLSWSAKIKEPSFVGITK